MRIKNLVMNFMELARFTAESQPFSHDAGILVLPGHEPHDPPAHVRVITCVPTPHESEHVPFCHALHVLGVPVMHEYLIKLMLVCEFWHAPPEHVYVRVSVRGACG